MTTLSRQPQKVFAGNANTDQLAVFGTMKTDNPQYNSNLSILQSNSAYLQGWADAIKSDKAPYLEEMNAVQYGFSYQLAYILQEGIPEYDNTTEYSGTSFVKTTNNGEIEVYRSLSDGNTGNDLSNTTYWKKIFSTGNIAVSLTGEVQGTASYGAGADTFSLTTAINQSNKIDGQWISKTETLSTSTSINTYTINLGTSGAGALNYLPADNNKYMVYYNLNVASKSNNYTEAYINGDIALYSDSYASSNVENKSTNGIFIVDSTRTISFQIAHQAANTVSFTALMYRRIGTNS